MQEKNKKILESIEKYENKFEYGLYLYKNEDEYYQNLLKSYFISTRNFLRTE